MSHVAIAILLLFRQAEVAVPPMSTDVFPLGSSTSYSPRADPSMLWAIAVDGANISW